VCIAAEQKIFCAKKRIIFLKKLSFDFSFFGAKILLVLFALLKLIMLNFYVCI